MNQELELVSASEDGRGRTTSLNIANRFGKMHKHVLQAIQEMECSAGFRRSNFRPTFYDVPGPNGAVRQEPMYEMTRDGFVIVAMGFTGKAAMEWKEAYIKAFNKMEELLFARYANPLPAICPKTLQQLRMTDKGIARAYAAKCLGYAQAAESSADPSALAKVWEACLDPKRWYAAYDLLRVAASNPALDAEFRRLTAGKLTAQNLGRTLGRNASVEKKMDKHACSALWRLKRPYLP